MSKRYRALQEFWYPGSRDAIRRLRAGEDVPLRERQERHVRPGDIIADAPRELVAGWLAKGRVEEVADGEDA